MNRKWMKALPLLLASFLLLTACANDADSNEFVLKNQDNEEVQIPNHRPALLFFFTTYT